MTRRGLFASMGLALAAVTFKKFKPKPNVWTLRTEGGTQGYTLSRIDRPKVMYVKQVWRDGSETWAQVDVGKQQVHIFPAGCKIVFPTFQPSDLPRLVA